MKTKTKVMLYGVTSAASTFALAKLIDFNVIFELGKSASYLLVVSFASFCLLTLLRTFRLRYLTRTGYLIENGETVVAHTFFSNILPFRLGEASLAYYLKSKFKYSYASAAGIILLNKASELYWIAALLLTIQVTRTQNLGLGVIVYLASLAAFAAGISNSRQLIEKTHLGKYQFVKKLISAMSDMPLRRALSFTAMCQLIVVFMFVPILFIYLDTIPAIKLHDAYFAWSLTYLGFIIPSFTFGNYGLFESLQAISLSRVGYDLETGASVGLITHTAIILFASSLYLMSIVFLKMKPSRKQGIRETQQLEGEA